MTQLNSLVVKGRLGGFVFQKVDPRFGNVPGDPTRRLQVRVHVPFSTSNTPAQANNRARFAQAVAAYRLLSPEQVSSLRQRAGKKGLTAYNLFISQWLRANP